VKDEVDINSDSALATFVINSHIKNHPDNVKISSENLTEDDPDFAKYQNMTSHLLSEDVISRPKQGIPQELLKKYIIYSRKYIKPKLTGINNDKITKFYTSLRQESHISG
jgi:DNA replication licensing factor MCM2